MSGHEITRELQRLSPKLRTAEPIVCFLAASVNFQDRLGKKVHGFGLLFMPAEGRSLEPVRYRSHEGDTNEQRALVGGLLTACEWLELNAEPSARMELHSSSEYIYHHFPNRLDVWIKEPKRQNADLIAKISKLERQFRRIEFVKADVNDPNYIRANDLARQACYDPQFEVSSDDVFGAMDDDDDLYEAMLHAVTRDPY